MRRNVFRVGQIVTLSVAVLGFTVGSDAEPPKEIAQDTRTQIKFAIDAKPSDATPFRYAIVKARKDGKESPTPKNLALDAGKGEVVWTPTPSQAGKYEFTVSVKDAKDKETEATVKIVVRERAISADNGPIGKLLRQWHADGTAAGNTGDFFDNRDRDHSPLGLDPYPQLDQVTYTAEDRKANRDWALQPVLLPHVTFGNSSTSAPPTQGGSNVRSYYAHPRGLEFLYSQYRGNNLYMYPAHHDHHPGHNGKPFYGDLFPANSPYLITSQGSSGTDQPFMRALPVTLAAFRPEAKKKLIENGLLMPTVQMIFRATNKHLKDPKEYLTGKAHPPVFEGSWVDAAAMVNMAHDMDIKKIPPMIQLKAVEEDGAVEGKDHFDAGLKEKQGDTPAAIARVVRSGQYVRRMVVSAEESFDINKNPLTYQWVILRGDAERIKIKPLNEAGSKVELLIPYHERRTVEGAPLKIESNRVEIGAFVHNGTYHSAPGFVTFFALDNEARRYDDAGRLLERAFGVGETDISIGDWNAFFDVLKGSKDALPTNLLTDGFSAEALAVLHKASEEYESAVKERTEAQAKSKMAGEARAKAAAALKAADDKLQAAKKAHDADATDDTKAALTLAAADRAAAAEILKAADSAAQTAQKAADVASKMALELLTKMRPVLDRSVKEAAEAALRRLQEDPGFYETHRQALIELMKNADASRKGRMAAARQRLVGFGVARFDGDRLEWTPLRPGKRGAYEQMMVERFNAELLAAVVYPKFLTATFKVNLVDGRLYTAKTWRDVYRYDISGRPLGWTRYDGDNQTDFNTQGEVILEKDEQGRPLKTRAVRYELDDLNKNNFPAVVKQAWSDRVLHYVYADEKDIEGKVAREEKP